ncbi:MAG TPA: hypothetical protein VNO22_06915 [Planctomycetota bacterium]|nr:hypothetical protein [Planctomycetota bacterium]
MSALLWAAVLALQEEPLPADERALERRAAELEVRLERLEDRIREAVDRGDVEAARRHNEEYRRTEERLEALRRRLEEVRGRRPPASVWYEDLAVELHARLTHWDGDLELEDGAGWGAALYVRNAFFAEVRRWETEDERSGEEATVQAYLAGFRYDFGLDDPAVRPSVRMGAGAIRFASEAPGAEGDTGPLFSFQAAWTFRLSPWARLHAAGEADLLRSDFNGDRTRTHHDFSLRLSIEIGF